MPCDAIVLNEWLLHDLMGENGVNDQQEAQAFLVKLTRECDYIVVLRGSRWTAKAYLLMKQASPTIRILSQFLHLAILRDPNKCHYLEPDEIQPLPYDLANEVPDGDAYLFQTALARDVRMVVTTDEKLLQRVTSAARRGITLRLRKEFLSQYLAS